MCRPLTHICAMPSQPLLPYLLLQTSTRPVTALQFLGLVLPAATAVSRTDETVQSLAAVVRILSQLTETLSPSFKVKGFAVRAQWYPPQEWVAYATEALAPRTSATKNTKNFRDIKA